METEINEILYKAFFDVLQENLSSNTPDYDWIARLYGECKDRLLRLVPSHHRLSKEIQDTMDVALFEQMCRHRAFEPNDFLQLVQYTFSICLQLGSHQRDQDVKHRQQSIMDKMNHSDATLATLVPLFLELFHRTVDEIDADMEQWKNVK